jgi:tRNA threonylcarbamoyladenosine biosynthesis protein TsaE
MNEAWLDDAARTEALGAALARSCPWSDREARLLYLQGDLGAGKTTLTRGLLRALGASGAVRSPTYTLLESYPLTVGLVLHVDLYRLRSAEELEELGLRDYFRGRTLLVIEWPERAEGALPAPDVTLRLDVSASGRQAFLRDGSDAGRRWCTQISI